MRYHKLIICYLGLAILFIFTACTGLESPTTGGDSGNNVPEAIPDPAFPPITEDKLETFKLDGFPHSVDVYAATGATQVIVFLHGASGSNYQIANGLGLNSNSGPATQDSVNWTWLKDHKIVAIFPQGQNIPTAPGGTCWSNRAMDSGVDDVAFLKELATYVRSHYGIAKVSVAGHSAGAMMVKRLWCEQNTLFVKYVSFAGPTSAFYLDRATACAPVNAHPLMDVIGAHDSIMQTTNNWDEPTWMFSKVVATTPAIVNPQTINEWFTYQDNAKAKCGESPALEDKVVTGNIESYSGCGGQIQFKKIIDAEHGLSSIESKSGMLNIDMMAEFLN